ncbi:hypothetical protein CEJ87_04060 [Caldifermentibacillus hisashii]|nr:hypothetical protein CEJ87_04060 [Caldifermentibacillus hisashii]
MHKNLVQDSAFFLCKALHFYFAIHIYEVPADFIGYSVDVRIDDTGVYIFKDDKKVAEAKPVSMTDNAHVKRVRSPFSVTQPAEEERKEENNRV